MLLIVGAALLFGDGAITPAISVLSAVEGIEAVNPRLAPFALPAAIVILAALFFVQRFGTGGLGRVFGPVMLVWFLALGVLGGAQLLLHPDALQALNPMHGLALLAGDLPRAGAIIGAVVLAVTGAEALYADMGHFGRPAILRAWRWVVFPSLILNYLGQAAHVLRVPESAVDPNLFFLLAPTGGLREALVVLATAATVIASQALISGVFSLANQAMDLGYLPRLFVRHTSASARGQIYVPVINYLLGAMCLLLVLGFRSSSALAGAYGVAVTGAMIITTIAFAVFMVVVWRKPVWLSAAVLAGLLMIDLPLFLACLGKLLDGGLVPVFIAGAGTVVMLTWFKGRDYVHRAMAFGAVSVDTLGARMERGEFERSPVTQVFLVRKPIPDAAVASILEQYRRVKVIGEKVVILLLMPRWSNPHAPIVAIDTRRVARNFWVVSAAHGYMIEPDAPAILRQAAELSGGDLEIDLDNTFFVTTHEMIIADGHGEMPGWQRDLYSFMSRNVLPGPDYLRIPPDRLLVYNWMLRL